MSSIIVVCSGLANAYGMSETTDYEKQSGGISPNLKIIAALFVGLILGAWANDEFDDDDKGKFEFMFEGDALLKLNKKTGEAWVAPPADDPKWNKIPD